MSGGPSNISERWSRGDAISTFTPAERDRLRQDLRDHPAHGNAKDRDHQRLMTDLRALYEADFPEVDE